MNIESIRTFVVICEEGSFSAAARKLYITPSAIIQKVNKLEEEAGLTLFERQYNGVVLTDEGRTFHKHAIRILYEMNEMLTTCQTIHMSRSNSLRIGVHTKTLLKAWCEYAELYHDINCSYKIFSENEVDDAFLMLQNGKLDVLEWSYIPNMREMGTCFMNRFRDRVCCTVSRNHTLAKEKSVKLESIKGQPVFIYKHNYMDSISHALEAASHESGVLLNLKMINGEPNVLIDICNNGNVILVGEMYAKDLPLVHIPVIPEISIYYGIAYRENASQGTHKFLKFVEEQDRLYGVLY